MLRIVIVCNISRRMLRRKFLFNVIHIKKPIVYLRIRHVRLKLLSVGKLPCTIHNITTILWTF